MQTRATIALTAGAASCIGILLLFRYEQGLESPEAPASYDLAHDTRSTTEREVKNGARSGAMPSTTDMRGRVDPLRQPSAERTGSREPKPKEWYGSPEGRELQFRIEDLINSGDYQLALELIQRSVASIAAGPEQEILAVYAFRMIPYLIRRCTDQNIDRSAADLIVGVLSERPNPNLVAAALSATMGQGIALSTFARSVKSGRVAGFAFGLVLPQEGGDEEPSFTSLDEGVVGRDVLVDVIVNLAVEPVRPSEFAVHKAAILLAGRLGAIDALRTNLETARTDRAEQPDIGFERARSVGLALRSGMTAGTIGPTRATWYLDAIANEPDSQMVAAMLDALPLGADDDREREIAAKSIDGGVLEEGYRVLLDMRGDAPREIVRAHLMSSSEEDLRRFVAIARFRNAADYIPEIQAELERRREGTSKMLTALAEQIDRWESDIGANEVVETVLALDRKVTSLEADLQNRDLSEGQRAAIQNEIATIQDQLEALYEKMRHR